MVVKEYRKNYSFFLCRGGTESGLGLEDSKARPLFEDSDSTRTRKSRLEGTRESKILDFSKKIIL